MTVRILRYFCFTFFVFFLLNNVFIKGILISVHHVDGAFQTASGLLRISMGQFPGKDFFPYLGIGPIYLLYPFFELFGGKLTDSVIASHFCVFITSWISIGFLHDLILKPKKFSTSLLISSFIAVFILIYPKVINYLGLNVIYHNFSPGNSLRPIRAFIPYLSVIIYYFFIYKIDNKQKRFLSWIFLASFSLIWSNDYAIPTFGMLFVLFIFDSYIKKTLTILQSAFFLVLSLFFWFILLNLLTFGHAIALIKYNFIDVAHDQFWYFGSYNRASRIYKIQDLYNLFAYKKFFPSIILFLSLLISIINRNICNILVSWIGVVLLSGGILSCIGGHIDYGYFSAIYFWAVIVTLFYIIKFIILIFKKIQKKLNYDLSVFYKVISYLSLILVGLFLFSSSLLEFKKYKDHKNTVKINPDLFYVDELGGYLSNEWKPFIELARKNQGRDVYEEYWGIWSSLSKKRKNIPVDSVIHALGDTRANVESRLENLDMIISTLPAYTLWQSWNLSINYWFYQKLIENWSPIMQTSSVIVWKKNEQHRVFETKKCILNDNKSFSIDANGMPAYYEIRLNYKLSNPSRTILRINNNIVLPWGRYFSISPYAQQTVFPVFIHDIKQNNFKIEIEGNSTENLELYHCSAKLLKLDKNIENAIFPKK